MTGGSHRCAGVLTSTQDLLYTNVVTPNFLERMPYFRYALDALKSVDTTLQSFIESPANVRIGNFRFLPIFNERVLFKYGTLDNREDNNRIQYHVFDQPINRTQTRLQSLFVIVHVGLNLVFAPV